MSKNIIAVIGATGAQGGGLIDAILNDKSGEFTARAITRNPNSDKAKALAARGIDVVAGDADDLDSLKRAFSGAYGAFCVTNFWEHFSPEKERQQAENMAAAARAAGIKHVIWSTLEDTRKWVPVSDTRMPTLKEKYKVPHFDSKGESDKYFLESGVPATLLLTAFYWENFIYFGMLAKGPDGKLGITFPLGDKKLPGIAVGDIGRCALGIFNAGNQYQGKYVGIAGEHLSGNEMATKLSAAIGQPVVYNDVPADVYRSFPFPGADDLGNMFQFKRDFNNEFVGARNLNTARALNPELKNFDTWLRYNAAKIPTA